MKKTLTIGISAGIAGVKVEELIQFLLDENIDIEVIMTDAAKTMFNPSGIEQKIGKKVYTNLFYKNTDTEKILKERKVEHIDLAGRSDLIVVVPATANIIAKIASGIADDYLTTTILASTCPVVICPSMNIFMWTNPITQSNVKTLRDRGFIILGPDKGMLACGYEGEGRLIDVKTLVKEIKILLSKTESLKGKKVLVTAGGTHEYIDDVRFIANKSSGKMGAAIAEACYLRGADVLLIRSSDAVHSRYKINERIFETSKDLQTILKEEIPNFDICFHAAAVSDFTIPQKIKGKLSSSESLHLDLLPSTKILEQIKKINSKIFLIGFKAMWNVSDNELIAEAKNKLMKSQADYIVANDVGKSGQGFTSDQNEVILVDKKGDITNIPLTSKTVIAEKIVDSVL